MALKDSRLNLKEMLFDKTKSLGRADKNKNSFPPGVKLRKKREGIYLFNNEICPAAKMFLIIFVRLKVDGRAAADSDNFIAVDNFFSFASGKTSNDKNYPIAVFGQPSADLLVDDFGAARGRIFFVFPSKPKDSCFF